MPSFEQAFNNSRGMSINYNGLELHSIDRISVTTKFSGTIKLISTNSEWLQAACLRVSDKPQSNKLKIGDNLNIQVGKKFALWEDYLENDIIRFEGTSKDGQLIVYNAWREEHSWGDEKLNPFTNFWQNGAAMIVEINGNTRRYRCNDGHPDDNFDDIVFEITID